MSRADLERFTAEVQSNPALEVEFSQVKDDPHTVVQWASKRGYDLTSEEAGGLASSFEELSDDELENVAGGWDGPEGGG